MTKEERLMQGALYRVGVYHLKGDDLTTLAARANDGFWFSARTKDYDAVARDYVQTDALRPRRAKRALSVYELEHKV